MSADPFGPVIRDLLTRHLAAWVPDALRRSRRATFVQAYARPGHGTAEAALRALGDLAGPLPLQVICDMMGIPEDDHQQVFAWTNKASGTPTSPRTTANSSGRQPISAPTR